MNKLFIIFVMILVIPSVMAYTTGEIREKAVELTEGNYSIEHKIWIIDDYMYHNNNYKFFHKPRSLDVYWRTMVGDCTEIARTKSIMYSAIGVKNRIVHGYSVNGKKYNKHDWTEYTLDNQTWTNTESQNGYKLIKKGRGVW